MPGAAPYFTVLNKHTAPSNEAGFIELTAGTILALAALTLAGGFALSLVTIAMAITVSLILSLALGYNVDFESDQAGEAKGTANQKFRLKFRRKPNA